MSEPIWIVVASAREGLDVVQALKRRGIPAVLVAGPTGCKVRVAPSGKALPALLHEAAVALERSRADVPLEAV